MKRIAVLLAGALLLAACAPTSQPAAKPAEPAKPAPTQASAAQPVSQPAATAPPAKPTESALSSKPPALAKKELKKIVFADAKAIVAPQEEVPIVAVAQKLGYLAEEGLEVEMQSANGSAAALQLLASGSAQIAAADGSSVAAANQAGQPIKAYFVLVRNWPWSVAVMENSDVKSLADLKGKNMGVISLQSGGVPYAKAMIKSGGLEPETDVPLVAVGQGAQAAAALQSGQVAAVTLYGAAYAALENAGMRLRYFSDENLEKDLFSLALAANDDYIKNNRDVVVGFGRAAAKGLVFTQTNPEAAMKIGYEVFPNLQPKEGDKEKALKDDVNVLNKWMDSAIFRPNDPNKGKWGMKSSESWQAMQEYFVGAGVLKEKSPTEKVWDPSLLDDVNQFDMQKIVDQAKQYK